MTADPPPIQQPVTDLRDETITQVWIRWFDQVYENLDQILGTGVTSVNGATGVVVLDLDDINDVSAGAPSAGDVLYYNGSWVTSNFNSIAIKQRNTSNTTITNAAYHWFGNTDGGGFTYTLPAGVDGEGYRIVNTGSSGNDLTITPDGSDDLLGANSSFTLADGEALLIVFDSNDGWY